MLWGFGCRPRANCSIYLVFSNSTWLCDVEEVGPGWRLAGVGVKVEEDGPEDGEEDAPGVGAHALALRPRGVLVAQLLAQVLSTGHQNQT